MNSSVVVRGGTVYDGAAPDPVVADVRLESGRVTALGPSLPAAGAREIDARGAWVTPGFIDAHSHSDLGVLSGKEMELRARAGVTTEIVGQDGLGFAPATETVGAMMQELLAPITGEVPPACWTSVATYLDAVERGAFARVATLVPHGAVRAAVMGRAQRTATANERAQMGAAVALGMAEGAVGLSSGLSYPPALWSDTDELVELAAAMPAGRGRYVTHLRDYGTGFDLALDEALAIGGRSDRPVHLSHFHVSGSERAATAPDYLRRLDTAAATGVQLSWDSYPYTVACTFLTTVLPADLQALDHEQLIRALAVGGRQTDVIAQLDRLGPGPTVAAAWDRVVLAGLAGTPLRSWDGRTVVEIAEAEGRSPGAVVVEAVLRLHGSACILVSQGHLDNVLAIARRPEHVIGSDGIPGSGVPHPRASGAFLRFLRWARDGVLDLSVAEMVSHMTGRPAALFGLPTGRLAVGRPADLLVLDPSLLDDGPDMGPHRPQAVRYSFLAGQPVLDDGRWLAPRLPGLALRGGVPR